MSLFTVPKRPGRQSDLVVAKKSKVTRQAPITIKGNGSLQDRIATIKGAVERYLGKYKDRYMAIRDENTLNTYLDECIKNGVISIDTETDGLDPILNHIAGVCIYTPGQRGAYIPINHISYITQERVKNQLEPDVVCKCMQRIIDAHIDVDMFNAVFDIRVLRNQIGLKDIYCTWDGYLAARLMNENEPSNALKKLHQKYVLNGQEDAFTFEELFKGIPFTMIPINTGYLYAARDPEITYEYIEYQKKYLYYDSNEPNNARNGMNGVSWVFFNIEMPVVPVVATMEDTGVMFDKEYAQTLSVKYHKILDEKEKEFYDLCAQINPQIEAYKQKHPDHKLDDPISISSPTQLATLFYDILKVGVIDKKKPRGTGEDILKKINNPIAHAILDFRGVSKLLTTYIDKLPDCVNPNDGRIHCKFNQYGADTGRFSSNDPNLQNIPSHNKDIRKMFIANRVPETTISSKEGVFTVPDKWYEVLTSNGWKGCTQLQVGDTLINTCIIQSLSYTDDNKFLITVNTTSPISINIKKQYVMMSSDYSQQEPKVMTQMCQDPKMIQSYKEGKDLYAEIASLSFNKPYEDCLEFRPDGTTNKEGKERRSSAKSILLGVLYGRGTASIAEQLNTTTKKAQAIKDSVFKGFPAIPKFEADSMQMAEDLGYVTTLWGRKRRLPDLQLPEYEFKWKNGAPPDDDLLDFNTDNPEETSNEVPEGLIDYYVNKLNKCSWKDKPKIIAEAKERDSIIITNNGGKIAEAQRQCVNSRIQGSAADMSKLAMILVGNDKQLQDMGFKILIPVHDELIAECPEIYAKECKARFSHLMEQAAGSKLEIPIKCDVETTYAWYGDPLDIGD